MRSTIGALILSVASVSALADEPQIAAGKSAFNSNCSVCHSVREGANKIGPSLYGVVGRRAGSAPNYSYSSAMKSTGKVWDTTTLHAFVQNPRGFVPGTKMSYPGLHQDDKAEELISYLAALK